MMRRNNCDTIGTLVGPPEEENASLRLCLAETRAMLEPLQARNEMLQKQLLEGPLKSELLPIPEVADVQQWCIHRETLIAELEHTLKSLGDEHRKRDESLATDLAKSLQQVGHLQTLLRSREESTHTRGKDADGEATQARLKTEASEAVTALREIERECAALACDKARTEDELHSCRTRLEHLVAEVNDASHAREDGRNAALNAERTVSSTLKQDLDATQEAYDQTRGQAEQWETELEKLKMEMVKSSEENDQVVAELVDACTAKEEHVRQLQEEIQSLQQQLEECAAQPGENINAGTAAASHRARNKNEEEKNDFWGTREDAYGDNDKAREQRMLGMEMEVTRARKLLEEERENNIRLMAECALLEQRCATTTTNATTTNEDKEKAKERTEWAKKEREMREESEALMEDLGRWKQRVEQLEEQQQVREHEYDALRDAFEQDKSGHEEMCECLDQAQQDVLDARCELTRLKEQNAELTRQNLQAADNEVDKNAREEQEIRSRLREEHDAHVEMVQEQVAAEREKSCKALGELEQQVRETQGEVERSRELMRDLEHKLAAALAREAKAVEECETMREAYEAVEKDKNDESLRSENANAASALYQEEMERVRAEWEEGERRMLEDMEHKWMERERIADMKMEALETENACLHEKCKQLQQQELLIMEQCDTKRREREEDEERTREEEDEALYSLREQCDAEGREREKLQKQLQIYETQAQVYGSCESLAQKVNDMELALRMTRSELAAVRQTVGAASQTQRNITTEKNGCSLATLACESAERVASLEAELMCEKNKALQKLLKVEEDRQAELQKERERWDEYKRQSELQKRELRTQLEEMEDRVSELKASMETYKDSSEFPLGSASSDDKASEILMRNSGETQKLMHKNSRSFLSSGPEGNVHLSGPSAGTQISTSSSGELEISRIDNTKVSLQNRQLESALGALKVELRVGREACEDIKNKSLHQAEELDSVVQELATVKAKLEAKEREHRELLEEWDTEGEMMAQGLREAQDESLWLLKESLEWKNEAQTLRTEAGKITKAWKEEESNRRTMERKWEEDMRMSKEATETLAQVKAEAARVKSEESRQKEEQEAEKLKAEDEKHALVHKLSQAQEKAEEARQEAERCREELEEQRRARLNLEVQHKKQDLDMQARSNREIGEQKNRVLLIEQQIELAYTREKDLREKLETLEAEKEHQREKDRARVRELSRQLEAMRRDTRHDIDVHASLEASTKWTKELEQQIVSLTADQKKKSEEWKLARLGFEGRITGLKTELEARKKDRGENAEQRAEFQAQKKEISALREEIQTETRRRKAGERLRSQMEQKHAEVLRQSIEKERNNTEALRKQMELKMDTNLEEERKKRDRIRSSIVAERRQMRHLFQGENDLVRNNKERMEHEMRKSRSELSEATHTTAILADEKERAVRRLETLHDGISVLTDSFRQLDNPTVRSIEDISPQLYDLNLEVMLNTFLRLRRKMKKRKALQVWVHVCSQHKRAPHDDSLAPLRSLLHHESAPPRPGSDITTSNKDDSGIPVGSDRSDSRVIGTFSSSTESGDNSGLLCASPQVSKKQTSITSSDGEGSTHLFIPKTRRTGLGRGEGEDTSGVVEESLGEEGICEDDSLRFTISALDLPGLSAWPSTQPHAQARGHGEQRGRTVSPIRIRHRYETSKDDDDRGGIQ